jgi:SPP1 gp7 family putative phage head morphogenesis protein
MVRRFRAVKSAINKMIVDHDCFAFDNAPIVAHASFVPKFTFPRSQDKIKAFMEWLRKMVQDEVLQIGTIDQLGVPIDSAWTDLYIADSYKRGITRARYELGKAGYDVPSILKSGGVDAVLGGTPIHLDRVGVLYTRVYSDLRGITDAMDAQISRLLAQGMIDGDNPRRIARTLCAAISGPTGDLSLTDVLGRFIPAERRALTLARTEVIRAHHLGTVQEYRNWGVGGVRVMAEFKHAGDSRVCDECRDLEGKVYTLDDIEGVIPVHPNCRCCALPVDMTGLKEEL